MRTLAFILAGLALLGIAFAVSPASKRSVTAAGFIAVWLIVSGVNLAVGLSHGYSLKEELVVHLFLFGIPALPAFYLWWRNWPGAGGS